LEKYLWIGLGGFLGANARYLVGGWAADRWGAAFPFGTLLVNVSGSFLLGLFLAATTERFLADPRWRLMLAVGFLGAYTTFSTYTYETMQMIASGGWWPGVLNALANNAVGLLASALGIALGRSL